MTADDRFSVVLCTHNGARFIAEQIASILHQGDAIAVIHVHDFASTDATLAVLERLRKETGDRIAITRHDDAPGAAMSFVRALRLTIPMLGDRSLVFLADQDDVWLPEKLAAVGAALAEHRLSPAEPFVLLHDVAVVDERLRTLRPSYYTGNPFRLPRDLDRNRLLMANPAIGHTMLLSAPLLRLIADWPDLERYLMHDWLAILIASRFGRVAHVARALSLYRQHDGNVLGAYRTAGKVASLARLLRFTDRVVAQAVAFARTAHDVERTPGMPRATTTRIEARCRRGYRAAARALALGAFVHGPTWQRKAIGVLLFARMLIGPGDETAERTRS